VQTCTLGEEAWILVIGFHGNMRVSDSKGPEQVSVEVAVHKPERLVTPVRGFAPVTVTGGGGSVAAGIIVADGMLRLPLDDFWPGFHLAPYAFGGFGGIFLGSPNNEGSFDETFTVTNSAGVSREVAFKGRVLSKIQRDFPGGIRCSATSVADSNIALLLT
jgi:hypothetical protein